MRAPRAVAAHVTASEPEPVPARRVLPAVLLLVAAVLGAYAGAYRNGFVNFDDDDYVTENPAVSAGLTAAGVRWAFTEHHAANWHPLTWLSHMLDVELFGLDPAGHHLTSVLLHALNAGLAFLALLRLTRAFLPSLLAAALFALHPLRVESVAWISERKDLLSGAFFLALLLAYEAWVRRGGARRYALVLLALALGLLSKPMLVTAPFVLLLLDVWPLRRPWSARLVAEKLPLLALAAGASVVTALVQARGGAVSPLGLVPTDLRIANAAVAYWAYVGLTLWPARLGALYPHPASRLNEEVSAWTPGSVAALAALVLVTVAALALARRRWPPSVGWLWYAGMLVPVIGLVQVGVQSWADRYTYLPSIGLSIALVQLGAALVARRPRLAPPVVGLAALALVLLALRTGAQVRVWRDSESLWTRTLAVTRANYLAHANLGSALAEAGRLAEAEQHFREALAINPYHDNSNNGLGFCMAETGRLDEALAHLRKALQANPGLWEGYLNVGLVHARRGHYAEALEMFERANRIHPDSPEVLSNLGAALVAQASRDPGRSREVLDRAVRYLEQAVALDPTNVEAGSNLGVVLRRLDRREEAERAFQRVLRVAPEDPATLENYAYLLLERGESAAGAEHLRRSLAGGFSLEGALTLARVLATSSDPAVRDGAAALRLAQECARARPGDPAVLDVLAAAAAASGDFATAQARAEEALALVPPAARGGLRARLEAYRAGRAWTDPALR